MTELFFIGLIIPSFFIGWIILSVCVGMYAGDKGRSEFGFFILAILLSPIIGACMAFIAHPDRDKIVAKRRDKKKCPYCAEIVQTEATLCKYCKSTFLDNNLIGHKKSKFSASSNRWMKS